ncbi:rnhA, partial [Mucuna pruriens]
MMLASPPILTRPVLGKPIFVYIFVSDNVEEDSKKRLIYYVNKVLQSVELRYQKIEKVALAIVVTARKINLLIKQILRKPDLAGRMIGCAVELSEFDIAYETRGHMKAQVLADFVNELTPNSLEEEEAGAHKEWTLSVYGSSNKKGSGVGIILEGLGGILIEQSLRFGFQASNNQAEYEALLARIYDSQLITGQVNGEYQAKDLQLTRYLGMVKAQTETFEGFTLLHVPREQNERANLLAKLASLYRTLIQKVLGHPTIKGTGLYRRGFVGQLYRRGFSYPLLQCLEETKAEHAIKEVHEGACESHIGGRALASKIAHAGFY